MSARRSAAERLVLGAPWAWLAVFFLIPFLIVVKISLSQGALAQPPYTPAFDLADGWEAMVGKLGDLSFAA
jgi:putrescine transport system permease protein